MMLSSVDASNVDEVPDEVIAREIYDLLVTARDVKASLLCGDVPEGCTEEIQREILETDLDYPTVSILRSKSGKIAVEVK